MRVPKTALTYSLVAALTLLGTPARAAELTQPLTAEEVACNERQLERLLSRLKAGDEVIAYPQVPKGVFVTYSNSVGFYEGLALAMQEWRLDIGQIPPTDAIEHYLAFNINPSIRTLLVNPARPELGQVSLGREQSNSNLVNPGSYFELKVSIDPSLPGNPQPDLLEINNFDVPAVGEPYNGFLANSTKPGRGLSEDGLLTSCHEKLTDFDRHVFAILQRVIRFYLAGFGLLDWEGAIFRGMDPHTYRFNIFPIAGTRNPPSLGRVAGEIHLSWTPEGKLTSGTWQMLPLCSHGQELGCTSLLFGAQAALITPVFGGVEEYTDDPFDRSIYVTADGPGPAVTVDFEKLLSKTTWNPPDF
jgi:hypothetical protein